MYEFLQLTSILLGLLALASYYYLTKNFNYWKKRGVPGPKPSLLTGNFPNLIKQKRHVVYDMDDIYRKYKGKERFVGIFMTRKPQLLILDPELVRDVLIKKFKNFHDNDVSQWADETVDPIAARNPFGSRGDKWKTRRAEVTPALSTNRIKAMYPVMENVCEKLTKYLEDIIKNTSGDGIDTKELATKFTTEVVSNCIYGIEAGAFSEKDCPILTNAKKMVVQGSRFFFYIMIATVFPIIKKIIKLRFLSKESEMFYTKLMEDAIKLRVQNQNDRADFLNYFLDLKKKKDLTDLDLTAHAMTFFFDGFETSSLAVTHFLLMMARYKDAQDKLRLEIQESVDANGKIGYDKLSEMPYLEQCFNETLRMFNPLVFATKMCTEPCEMLTTKEKRILIEKDMPIQIPVYSIHHDEEYYPDPFKFDPDRMTPDNVKKLKDMGVFLPFGDGPRICLGMRFGTAQSKAAVVEIIKNWEVSVNEKTRKDNTIDKTYIVAMVDGGIYLNFKRLET